MKSIFGLGKAAKIPEWLLPISDAQPCGPNLEYDPEYAVLIAKMLPKGEAQYGDFIGTSEAPNWAEIERDCRRMLLRSRDITIFVLLLRCRVRLSHAEGLKEGLTLLVEALETYPEDIHPQLTIDGELDKAVRANAIATLTDPEGVLADIREIVLSKNTAMRLQVRDVERAFAVPRAADALSPDSVKQQLSHLRHKKEPAIQALIESAALVERLSQWNKKTLAEDAPDLVLLERLLNVFSERNLPHSNSAPVKVVTHDEAIAPHSDDDAPTYQEHMTSTDEAPVVAAQEMVRNPATPITFAANIGEGRVQALDNIRQTREWFEAHEPSSPVSVLLRQAERLVGKTFAEVAQSIPLELLQKWEKED